MHSKPEGETQIPEYIASASQNDVAKNKKTSEISDHGAAHVVFADHVTALSVQFTTINASMINMRGGDKTAEGLQALQTLARLVPAPSSVSLQEEDPLPNLQIFRRASSGPPTAGSHAALGSPQLLALPPAALSSSADPSKQQQLALPPPATSHSVMGTQQQLPLPGAGSVDLPEVQARLGSVFAKASAAVMERWIGCCTGNGGQQRLLMHQKALQVRPMSPPAERLSQLGAAMIPLRVTRVWLIVGPLLH